MRVVCRHGHIAFYPRRVGEVARFCNYFAASLVSQDDFFTFPVLAELERHSILGKVYGNLPATTTYEGRNPWEVMRENGFVYHVASELLLPKSSILIPMSLPLVGDFFLSPTPLIQPGSRNESGQQILSYDGEYIENLFQLRVSEVSYE